MDRRELTPEVLMKAYGLGVFPMAESRDDPAIFWVDPRRRGVLPLDAFHMSRSLARHIRRGGYDIAVDQDFAGVMEGCASRPETWITGAGPWAAAKCAAKRSASMVAEVTTIFRSGRRGSSAFR